MDGAFSDGADWSGGSVPGAGDNAILDAPGSPFTVTSATSKAVAGIQLAANSTLAITGGTFTASGGTNGGANDGHISVRAGATFATGGALAGGGGITLDGGAVLLQSNTTLTGGGTVALAYGAGPTYARINGAGSVGLTNVNDTIAGAGRIGESAGFTFVNGTNGVVNANSSIFGQRLIIGYSTHASGAIVNNGLLEAGPARYSTLPQLDITCRSLSGAGGQIYAGAYGDVEIVGAQISGQTFSTAAQGGIALFSDQVAITGTVADAGSLLLSQGEMTLGGGVTLTGGGGVYIDGGSQVSAGQRGATLTNIDTYISLSHSRLGGGGLSLINEAAGTIDGSGFIAAGAAPIVNAGLIEAVAVGVLGNPQSLTIKGALENTGVIATGEHGTLIVEGAVTGSGSAVITSGGSGGGMIAFGAAFSEDVTFDQDGPTRQGLSGLGTLRLADSQDYCAAISGFSAKGLTALDLRDIGFVSAGEASFSGTSVEGVLTVSDGAHTARITLIGNFTKTSFTAVGDGHGGTEVVAKRESVGAGAAGFVAAMASLSSRPANASIVGWTPPAHAATLMIPRPSLA